MKNFCKATGLLFSQKLSRLKSCDFFKNNTLIWKLSSIPLFSDHIDANKTVLKIQKIFEKFDVFCKAIGLIFSQKWPRLKSCDFFKNNTLSWKLSSLPLFSNHINGNRTILKRENFFEKFDDFCKAIGLLFSQKFFRLKNCDFFRNNTLILKLSTNLLFSDHINGNKTVFKMENVFEKFENFCKAIDLLSLKNFPVWKVVIFSKITL